MVSRRLASNLQDLFSALVVDSLWSTILDLITKDILLCHTGGKSAALCRCQIGTDSHRLCISVWSAGQYVKLLNRQALFPWNLLKLKIKSNPVAGIGIPLPSLLRKVLRQVNQIECTSRHEQQVTYKMIILSSDLSENNNHYLLSI